MIDKRVKIPGVRVQMSYVIMMRSIAKEKGIAISALYNDVVAEYLKNNRPPSLKDKNDTINKKDCNVSS